MASLSVIENNRNAYDDCKKKLISFPRTIICSQNFTMAEKAKRMAFNPGPVLKNHQELTRKIGKRGSGCRQHS